MTYSHSVLFSIAGPRAAINKAILLMARNVLESANGGEPEDGGDPTKSYEQYHSLISEGYANAFTGKGSARHYLSDAASISFQDNNELCAFALSYHCAEGIFEHDLNLFLTALSKTLGPSEEVHACVFDATERDLYGFISVHTARAAQDHMSSIPNKGVDSGRLFLEARDCYKPGPETGVLPQVDLSGIGNPAELARKLATTCWSDWDTASVVTALCNLGILPWDNEEACEIFGEDREAVLNHFFAGNDNPFEVTRWDQK